MSHKVPNFRRSVLARSILIACGATATVFASQPLFAQDAETKLQRRILYQAHRCRVGCSGHHRQDG